MHKKNVVVIGSGLGGLSAAISLAQEGYAVTIHEKNAKIGGKLNVLKERGYSFDLGPSILTLPHIFGRLFERSGRKMSDYIPIRPLRPHWRNHFEDGKVVDLYALVNEGYFEQGLDTVGDFMRHYGLWKFPRFDLLRTMHGGVKRFLRT